LADAAHERRPDLKVVFTTGYARNAIVHHGRLDPGVELIVASYLIEDVFRIGDYIEGGNAKGTVERITFRTVALRHQNGPLHFVPYGTLGSVRNNSRDWVVTSSRFRCP
jgi:Mechanosensitive ion channel